MKTKTNWLLGAMTIMAALLCTTGRAQSLIYSNSFVGGNQSVSVYQTPPTYATTLMGGSGSAVWICTLTNLNAAYNNEFAGCGTVYQGGNIGTNQGIALLPLAVQTNAVYILNAQVSLPSPMTSEVEMGFTTTNTFQYNFTNFGFARFNDAPPTGYAWDYMKVGSGTTFFGGSKTSLSTSGGPGGGSLTAGTHNLEIILNTLNNTNAFYVTNAVGHAATNYWVASSYIDGLQVGTNVFYVNSPSSPAPIQLEYCGIGQATFVNQSVSGIQWNYFTVSTPLAPMITQQPMSGATNQGSVFVNTVVAIADTNGGALSYQWYTNGVPLANGGNISGANTASLTFNTVQAVDAGNDYYVVVTNTYGSVTSSPASLTIYGAPQFTSAYPITYTNLGPTNLLFLYGGTNNGTTTYYGSSPTFTVLASGAQPISYQWLTNGAPVGGATNTSFTFTNCQWSSPTNFTCVASNVVGTATNQWLATYLPPPTTPFQQSVLAAEPLGYWRLNEKPDDNSGDNGKICTDYQSGNNGIYTNVILNQASDYSPTTDPNEISAQFGTYSFGFSDANSIGGNNIDFSSKSNAEYTVALWANGSAAGGVEPQNGGLFSKGIFSQEEFCIDTAPNNSYGVRLTLRNAAGTQYNAISTLSLGTDPNWHYIVGVCDESNGLVSLYIDGALAAQTSIPPGSGIINSANAPLMIGARGSTNSVIGDQQFEGNINDVAIYGYAMNASQVLSQYQASGNTVTPYVLLLSPLPPTNVVYETNTTVTIPATAFGTPPFGYYWTNVTAGGILASGTTNAVGSLDATLTIPNISAGLNGDELELVVTNASAFTNWFVNLAMPTPPPPSLTLSYSNSIVYSNSFPSSTVQETINGLSATAANFLVGGSNVTWICTYTNSAPSNGTVYANGTLGTNAGSALVPFTPEPGYIYTMTGTILVPSAQGDWVSMGFSQSAAQSGTPGTGRFTDSINGYAWMYMQLPNAFLEPGPKTTVAATELSGLSTVYPVTNTLQIVLNTVTNNAWVTSAYVNGTNIGTYYYNTNLPIAYAGIGQNDFPGSERWISWTISQVAPGGVPPYIVPPLPSTSSIVLTNATITIPATGFGSAVLGYSWINNSTVIASGTTNNMAPLPANLSIASTSLSAGQLELVVTNAYGTNITIIPLVSPIPTTGTNITWGVTNGTLYLSWPSSYTGYQLQAETNSLSVGITNDWVNMSGSTTTNMVSFPINITNGSVFYRLIYTP